MNPCPSIPRHRSIPWLAVLCLTTMLAGCESPVRLMPTPVSFRTGDTDPFANAGTTALGS